MGYINRHDETGKKYIARHPKQEPIMEWAFKELAKGLFSTGEVYPKAAEMGLDCKRNNFFVAIRNPVYCGRILIVGYKDEEAHTVKGLHEGIISESLFCDVQEVLDGNKRTVKAKLHSPEMLPLRGFIRCSKCSRMLCGSASKGRNGYYYYYHCSSACGCRYKADEVNELFITQLRHYNVNSNYVQVFTDVISDTYYRQFNIRPDNRSEMLKEINKLTDKISRARDLLLNGDIDGADYKAIKQEAEGKNNILEARLAEMIAEPKPIEDIRPLVANAISKLTRLNVLYTQSSTCDKRELIGSMYPQKFTFEELQHRTATIGELYSYIYLINSEMKGNKKGQATVLPCLPIVAPQTGLEPISNMGEYV